MGCFADAIKAFDAANSEDPNQVPCDGGIAPKELVYGRRMSAMLALIYPDAGEALQLAVRAQHIRRWELLRTAYAEGRAGYLQWRSEAKRRHAEVAGNILRQAGYDGPTITRVGQLIRKERLKQDTEAQQLEDIACLVFLEDHLADFAPRHEEAKIIDVIAKTWMKMSHTAQQAALALKLPAEARRLVGMALSRAGDRSD